MAYSLLAHLFPYIKGSQEDVATFSLQYLLSQSAELNRAFTKRIADLIHDELDEKMQYVCQITGKSEEKERPDMAGIDATGSEDILFEMKFYASLTANQPLTYLKRLKENGGHGLVFVCPIARRTNLWAKLLEICSDRHTEPVDEYCVKIDGVKLALITWSEVLELLKQVAGSVDTAYSSDVAQLEGYCNKMDSDAFIPFVAGDLSAETARKAERYYDVLDEVIELLLADTSIKTSKKGTKPTAYRRGYTRSIYIDEFTITFNYDRELWKNPASIETPFWLAIRDEEWNQTEDIVKKLMVFPDRHKEHFWNMIFLAIEPIQNATFSEVCEDMKEKILHYIDIVRGIESLQKGI